MKQIQPFQKHRLQLTSIVVCRLKRIRQRQPEDSTRILWVLGFGASYIRDLTVVLKSHFKEVEPNNGWLTHWVQNKNCHHLADDILICIFLIEDVLISLKISLKFVPKVQVYNIPALVQIMAWRRPCDRPLSGPMMVSLLTHINVTQPQWFNYVHWGNESGSWMHTIRMIIRWTKYFPYSGKYEEKMSITCHWQG